MLPSIQMILFCLCIGGEPYHLSLSISNADTTTFPLPPYAGQTAGDLYIEKLDVTTFVLVMSGEKRVSYASKHIILQYYLTKSVNFINLFFKLEEN